MGCRYGAGRPHKDIPLIVDLYLAGRLKLDELVTKTYDLDDIQQTHRRHAPRRPRPRRAHLLTGVELTDGRCPTSCRSWPQKVSQLGSLGRRRRARHAEPDRRRRHPARRRRWCATAGTARWPSRSIQTRPSRAARPGRTAPLRTMLMVNQTFTGQDGDAGWNDDTVSMALAAGTHIDALGPRAPTAASSTTASPTPRVTRLAGRHPVRRRQARPDHDAAACCSTCRAPRASSASSPATPITADDLDAAVELAEGHARCPATSLLRAHRPDAAPPRRRQSRPTTTTARACRPTPSSGSATATSARCSPTPTSTRCGRPRTGRR